LFYLRSIHLCLSIVGPSGLFMPWGWGGVDQCCGPMTFWGGSGSGSGSADPCLWLPMVMNPDRDADPSIFVIELMPTKN
jgi:hypothetical protein